MDKKVNLNIIKNKLLKEMQEEKKLNKMIKYQFVSHQLKKMVHLKII